MASNYTPTKETANFGKFAKIILDLCRDAVFQILAKEIAPAALPSKIRANLHCIRMSTKQLNKIFSKPPGVPPGETDFDISALYTLVRNICPGILSPSQGWDNPPGPSDILVSDDIERIREKRNVLYGHAYTAALSDTEFNNEMAEMRQIISRLDTYLGQNFMSGLCAIQGSTMDPDMELRYSQRCQQLLKQDQETREQLDNMKDQLMGAQIRQEETIEMVQELRDKQTAGQSQQEETIEMVQELRDKQTAVQSQQEETIEMVQELRDKQTAVQSQQEETVAMVQELKAEHAVGQMRQEETIGLVYDLQDKQEARHLRQEESMEMLQGTVTDIQRKVEVLSLREDQTPADRCQDGVKTGKVKGSTSKFKKLKRRLASIFGRSKEMATVRRDVDDKVAGIQRQVEDQTQTDLQQRRNEATLQRHMCAMYEEELFLQVTTIPLFGDIPLSEVFTPIIIREDLEATLNLEARKSGASRSAYIGQSSQINKKVQSYREMFQKDGKAQKNVYLLGKAGSGKTTFCRHLLDVWCKQSGGTAQYDNPETIHNFAFVFLVFCRHADTSDKVIDMIFDQLLTGLDNEYQSLVRHVLRTKPEKCLIIIDGLDEWAGSPSRSTGPGTPSGLPDRRGLENCVFLTTSRPWRIEALRQGVGKSYRIMEIQGLTDNGLKELARKVMKSEHESQSDQEVDVMVTDFISCVEKAKLGTVLETPLMIVNVLALWHDCKSLDMSMCVNYSQMIELLLLHAKGESDRSDSFNRLAGLTNLCSASGQDRPTLPQCFDSLPSSQLYAILIHKLARLAFERLFHTEKEKSLVFSMPELAKYFQKSEIAAILKIGIFSLSAAYSKSMKRLSTVSFLHKTVQEFLAAVWMAVDRSGDCLSVFRKYCTCVADVLDLSVFIAFLCGLSPEKGREVWRYIGELTASDPAVQRYRAEIGKLYMYITSSYRVPRLQQLLLQCTAEAMHHRPDMPLNYNIQDVYVDSGISVENLDLLLGHAVGSDTGIKTLFMSGIKPSPEILETINRMVSLEFLVILSPPKHSDPKQLCEVIFTAVNSLSPVTSLILTRMSIAAPNRLFTVQLPQRLKSLTLGQVSITGRMSWPVTMETLYMNDVTLDHDSVLQLATRLQGSSSLQQLCIESLKCRDCGDRCQYQLDVTRHTRLHSLKLRHLSVDRVQVTPSNLETVVLWELDKPGAAGSVISSLHLAPQLTELKVWWCRLSQGDIARLCSVLPRLSQLVKLELYDINCDDLAVCVSDLSRLREIKLWDVTMSDQAWSKFARSLPPTSHQLTVELCNVTMSDQAWSKFARSLPPTSHQLTVKLWRVNIDAATVSYIAAHFTVTLDNEWWSGRRDLDFHSREQT